MNFAFLTACLLLSAEAGATPGSVVVPDLSGRPAREAAQLGGLAGYEVVIGDFFIAPNKWRPDIVPETIYLQSPRAGAAATPGTTLAGWRLVRADGSQSVVTMPDLRGKHPSEVRDLLRPLGLPLLATTETERIFDQYPRPGQKILAGTSVFIVTAPAGK